MPHASTQEDPQQVRQRIPPVILSSIYMMLWAVFSSTVIIFNKRILSGGFPYPLAVTGMGQLAGVVAGLAMSGAGVMSLRPVPSPGQFLRDVCPIVAACSTTLFFGNGAYLFLSVAFIQILKALTPAVTLVLAALLGLERLTARLVLAVVLIAVGTGAATLVESGTPSFHWWGLCTFMLSSVTEALRAVLSERVMGRQRYNTAQVLVHIGAPTTLCLLGASAVWELPLMLANGSLAAQAARLPLHATAYAVSAAVNLLGYLAIRHTSSLTFKVVGCLKNIALVGYSVAAQGELISVGQVAGYLVSVSGFLLYTLAKFRTAKKKSA